MARWWPPIRPPAQLLGRDAVDVCGGRARRPGRAGRRRGTRAGVSCGPSATATGAASGVVRLRRGDLPVLRVRGDPLRGLGIEDGFEDTCLFFCDLEGRIAFEREIEELSARLLHPSGSTTWTGFQNRRGLIVAGTLLLERADHQGAAVAILLPRRPQRGSELNQKPRALRRRRRTPGRGPGTLGHLPERTTFWPCVCGTDLSRACFWPPPRAGHRRPRLLRANPPRRSLYHRLHRGGLGGRLLGSTTRHPAIRPTSLEDLVARAVRTMIKTWNRRPPCLHDT